MLCDCCSCTGQNHTRVAAFSVHLARKHPQTSGSAYDDWGLLVARSRNIGDGVVQQRFQRFGRGLGIVAVARESGFELLEVIDVKLASSLVAIEFESVNPAATRACVNDDGVICCPAGGTYCLRRARRPQAVSKQHEEGDPDHDENSHVLGWAGRRDCTCE